MLTFALALFIAIIAHLILTSFATDLVVYLNNKDGE